ncbi:MAG: hypothetical protein M9928_17765 [Anaerolineae bacterium]|nr:hypothetical protein [Anaerolineae bacterium]
MYLFPLGIPYFDTTNNGAQEAAAELGVEVTTPVNGSRCYRADSSTQL